MNDVAAPPKEATSVTVYDSDSLYEVIDGRVVARASASLSEHGVTLFGGSTLPDARGRGA